MMLKIKHRKQMEIYVKMAHIIITHIRIAKLKHHKISKTILSNIVEKSTHFDPCIHFKLKAFS